MLYILTQRILKACANKKKNHKELIKIEAKKYQKGLELEIALKAFREDDFKQLMDILSPSKKDKIV